MPSSPTPFTRREALARGVTVRQLAGPGFQRVFHNLYLPAQATAGRFERASGVLRVAPSGSYASHHTAMALWGGWPPADPNTHISVPRGTRSVRRGVSSHRSPSASTAVRHRGLLVSPPEQASNELAAIGVGLVDLVVAGDSLIHSGRTTIDRLLESADGSRCAGARTARRAARLVREGVDSAPESRLRMLVVLGGLPEPKVNHILRSAIGDWRCRFDLCYPELRLIIEYDGRHHADDRRQWSLDIRRREELERDGWRFIVVNADALFNHPEDTLTRIWNALDDRGAPGMPVRRAAAWSQHFGSR
ncbi:MAG: endonuclease domain-containing protein [Propionibacteriaceae bacterium]